MKKLAVCMFIMYLLPMVAVYAAETEKKEVSYPTLKVNGYIQSRYTMDKDGENKFQVKRARSKFSGNASKNVRYSLLLDFIDDSKGSNLADAYVDIKCLPKATTRIGQFKTPFSMEYLTSSTKWDTIELAQVVSKLASKRDVGIQLSGDISESLGYAVGIFNGTGSNAAEENKRKDIVARGIVKPVKGLLLGVSHYEGKSGEADADKTKRRTGVQLAFADEPLSVKGEFIFGKNGETSAYGWYAQAGYMIPVSVGKKKHKVQAIAKYDSYDPNTDKESDKTDILTIGINCFARANVKLQLNNLLVLDKGFGFDNDVILGQLQVTW
ncbi:porin [Candidatus Poribacteria bacterium]